MKKNLLLLSLLAFSIVASLRANPELAEHYLSKAPQYLGKKVEVQVAYLTPYSAGLNKNGFQWFNAITASGSKSGGLIAIRVKDADAQGILQKYGQTLQYTSSGGTTMVTRPLSGSFAKTKLGKYYIECAGN